MRTVRDEFQVSKQELNDLLRRRAEFIIHRTRQKYYCSGSKPSRLLALKLKQCESKASIDSIQHPFKGLIPDSREINDIFRAYYQDLYASSHSFDSERCNSFLQGVNLPTLQEHEAADLGRPVLLVESLGGSPQALTGSRLK